MSSSPCILVTRAPHQASELADRLRELGIEPVLIPSIQITAPTTWSALDDAVSRIQDFDWLLFTSANSVGPFYQRLTTLPGTFAGPPYGAPSRIAAIGPGTGRALREIGLEPTLLPPNAVAESLAQALLPHVSRSDGTPAHFLLVRAEAVGDTPPRDVLPDTLRAAGAHVTIAPAYRTMLPMDSIAAVRELFAARERFPDAITFTSSSSARNLFTLLEAAHIGPGFSIQAHERKLEKPVLASIGPITSATLRELGHPPHIEAPEATVRSLAETLAAHLMDAQGRSKA